MRSFSPFEWPFSETVVERLGWVLLHSLWQFGLVALLAAVAVRAMRPNSAARRYVVLVVAMALSVAAPAVTWVLQPGVASGDWGRLGTSAPGLESNAATRLPANASSLAGKAIVANEIAAEGPASDVAVSRPTEFRLTVSRTGANIQPLTSWSQRAKIALRPWLAWLVAGWSLGVAICSLRPLLGWEMLRRLRRVGCSPASDEVLAAMRRVSARLGLRRGVRVMQSTLSRVPVVVGYMRPAILLPASLVTNIPAAQLEAILAHELAHVERHDFVVNLLQTLVETLFFYHPSVWWLSRQIRLEREHCCDDRVVMVLGNRVEYGRALVAIEELRGRRHVLALSAADGSLLARVCRIVGVDVDCAGLQSTARLGDRWPALCLGAGCSLLASMAILIGMVAAADQARFPPPKRDDVRGLDLSKVPVREWREAYRSTPDLYVQNPADPESWNHPKNVFQMPLAEHTWLKYPAGSGHFYIEHRPDGTSQNERLFGPIDGDPFKLLKLDDVFRERLEPGATSGDPRYRLRLMFATGEPALMRRAARLIEPELARDFSRDEEWLFRRIESLEIVREALRDEAASFGRADLQDLAAQLRRQVTAAEAAIDRLNDSEPDEEYQSATYLQTKIAATIPDALWGKPLDGLRLALVPREWVPGLDWNELPPDTPVSTSVVVGPGGELQYQLVVENVSDRDIKLCGYISGEEIDRTLEVFDRDGNRVEIEHLHTTIPHFRGYWRLKPDERHLLSMPSVHFKPMLDDDSNQGLGYFLKTAPGEYTLCCGMCFGQYDNTRHRHVPGQSEWIGQLTTGTQTITVADPTAASNAEVDAETRAEVDAETRAEVDPMPAQQADGPAFVLPDRLNVMAVGFDRDDKDLVSVSTEKAVTIRTWDVGEKKLKHEATLASEKHGNFFLGAHLTLSADRTRVVAAIEGQIGIWETATGKVVKMLALPDEMRHDMIGCLACTPDLSLIACGLAPRGLGVYPDAQAIVLEVASGKVLQTIDHAGAAQLHCVALSHDGKWLATGGQKAGTCVWDVRTGKRLLELPNANPDRKHPDPKVSESGANQVLCLSFSPDGKQLAIGDMLGVKLVDASSGELLHQLDAPFRYGRSGLVFSHGSQLLARIATDQVVPIWSTKTGKLVNELPTEAHGGSFSADDQWFAAGFTDEKIGVAVWRVPSGPAAAGRE